MARQNPQVARLTENLLTKEQALEKLQPYENCTELSVHGRTEFQIHPTQDNHFIMAYNNEEYVFNEHGFEKVARLVGIPHTYTRKIPSQYMFPHLQYWINEGDVGVKAFMRGSQDDDGRQRIAGFAHQDAYYYPISRVLDQVDTVTSDYRIEGLEDISWRHSTFGLVFPESRFDVETPEVGDVLFGGVKFSTRCWEKYRLRFQRSC